MMQAMEGRYYWAEVENSFCQTGRLTDNWFFTPSQLQRSYQSDCQAGIDPSFPDLQSNTAVSDKTDF